VRSLTGDLAGSGGQLRSDPEDFIVDEIPAYATSGEGEHLFLQIEKVGLTTPEAIRKIAAAIGVREHEIGAAGMKDKDARARQWLSLPWPVKSPLPDLAPVASTELRVIEAKRHGNKLRRGHQKGNRFTIVVRDVPPGGVERAQVVLQKLRELGVPNAFGPQRFGRDGDNAARAIAILRKEARPPRDRRLTSLLLSSLQSAVFNRVLETRIERGLFAKALLGDVMQKHDTHGLFDVSDPAAEQPRVDALAISPTGPLPGPKMRAASAEAKAIEDEAIAALSITDREIDGLDAGTRRALRYPLDSTAKIDPIAPDAYRLEVSLPSGAFATVLLAELMKPERGVVLRDFSAE
jgi:tRNA pseudouridine13 synthase